LHSFEGFSNPGGEVTVGIALVQFNPVIGDFSGNIKKITAWADRAKVRGCQLVIFPEMAVCGYPPQDLLERSDFLVSHDRALQTLLAMLPRASR
jgi:NAD+ synthase (glutamine-hydrolysing)